MTKKIAILISGRGSNMATLIEAAQAADFTADIALVISNKDGAGGLALAKQADIPTAVVPHRGLTREDFEDHLQTVLDEAEIDFICLAGFMRVLSASFVERWEGRMLNVHPSLLPLFRGLHVHEQALEAGVAVSGCSVHYVTPELDGGPIIGQAVVPVLPGDDAETLARRVQKAEHRLYPAALRKALGLDPQARSDTEVMVSIRDV